MPPTRTPPMWPKKARPLIALDARTLPWLHEVGAPYRVMPGIGWDDLGEVLRDAPPSTVVVVNPYAQHAGDLFPRVHDLLHRFPSVAVVAAVEVKRENAADVATLLDWGVTEVIALGMEGTRRAVRARLRQAHARPFKRKLEAALSPYVSAEARMILGAAAEVAVEGGGAPELAKVLRLTPRAVTLRCTRADLPAPRQVQAWMRILLACALLDDPGRTVYSVAYACGYSTDRSLRRAITALLGMDTTRLRRQGALAVASRAFNDMLREVRETGRERRRAERLGQEE